MRWPRQLKRGYWRGRAPGAEGDARPAHRQSSAHCVDLSRVGHRAGRIMCHPGVSHPGRAGPWVGAEEKKDPPSRGGRLGVTDCSTLCMTTQTTSPSPAGWLAQVADLVRKLALEVVVSPQLAPEVPANAIAGVSPQGTGHIADARVHHSNRDMLTGDLDG